MLVSKIPQFTLKLKGITLFKCFIKNTAYLTLYLYYNKTKKKKPILLLYKKIPSTLNTQSSLILQKFFEGFKFSNKFFMFKQSYLKYFILPKYSSIYFYLLKSIYVFYKSISFLQITFSQFENFFSLYFESNLNSGQELHFFNLFCLKFIPFFIKTKNAEASIIGVNFFNIFQGTLKKQVGCSILNKKRYKSCLLLLINYFSLFIKMQQITLKYKNCFINSISDTTQPFFEKNIVLTLEKNLFMLHLKTFLQILKYFRFFLRQKVQYMPKIFGIFTNKQIFFFNLKKVVFLDDTPLLLQKKKN